MWKHRAKAKNFIKQESFIILFFSFYRMNKRNLRLNFFRRWHNGCEILHADYCWQHAKEIIYLTPRFVSWFVFPSTVWKKGDVSMAQDLCWIFKIDANTIFSIVFFSFVVFFYTGNTQFWEHIFNSLLLRLKSIFGVNEPKKDSFTIFWMSDDVLRTHFTCMHDKLFAFTSCQG